MAICKHTHTEVASSKCVTLLPDAAYVAVQRDKSRLASRALEEAHGNLCSS